jgi:hypothetical protein
VGVLVIGACVSGFSALLVDRVLARHLPQYLRSLSPAQRREVDRLQRDVRAAADLYSDRTTAAVNGSGGTVAPEVRAGWGQDEVGADEAAEVLGCSVRRVRQLAAAWQPLGLARKVGRVWLIDRTAVLAHRDERGRRSA